MCDSDFSGYRQQRWHVRRELLAVAERAVSPHRSTRRVACRSASFHRGIGLRPGHVAVHDFRSCGPSRPGYRYHCPPHNASRLLKVVTEKLFSATSTADDTAAQYYHAVHALRELWRHPSVVIGSRFFAWSQVQLQDTAVNPRLSGEPTITAHTETPTQLVSAAAAPSTPWVCSGCLCENEPASVVCSVCDLNKEETISRSTAQMEALQMVLGRPKRR